jgi:hypothetical protein
LVKDLIAFRRRNQKSFFKIWGKWLRPEVDACCLIAQNGDATMKAEIAFAWGGDQRLSTMLPTIAIIFRSSFTLRSFFGDCLATTRLLNSPVGNRGVAIRIIYSDWISVSATD